MTGSIPRDGATHLHVTPRPAATVVLFRDPLPGRQRRDSPDGARDAELLLTRRPSTMAFGPDLHVFPGGAVEPDDAGLGDRVAGPQDPWSLARVAAVRELREEAGIHVDPADLVPLSVWTTPPIMPRRYVTRFFAAWLPPDAEPLFDPGEVVDHVWLTPSAALDAMADGTLQLWIPTSSTLQQLEGIRTRADIAPRFAALVEPGPPRLQRLDPVLTRVDAEAAGGIAGRPAVGWLVGRERLVLVDHGDPSEDVADLVIEALVDRTAQLDAIVLTSPHPDQSGGAEALALRLDVPILAARGAAGRLPHATIPLDDGDRIPFGDVRLTVRIPDDGSRTTLASDAGLRLPEQAG